MSSTRTPEQLRSIAASNTEADERAAAEAERLEGKQANLQHILRARAAAADRKADSK